MSNNIKPTQKAVPSADIKDLWFNSEKVDEFVTSLQYEYRDRFGKDHRTIEGINWAFDQLVARFKVDMSQAIQSAGYITIDSFQIGTEITQQNQVLRWALPDGNGEYYRWDGELPKTVTAGSTPESSGGVGLGAWVGIGDASLRGELGRVVKVCNTMNDISLESKTSSIINLLGYYAINDGGGGEFYFDESVPKNTHNGGDIIDPTKSFSVSTEWFKSINEGFGCYVRLSNHHECSAFGVLSDELLSDVAPFNFDNSIPLMNAQNYAKSKGISLNINAGTYVFRSSIRLIADLINNDTATASLIYNPENSVNDGVFINNGHSGDKLPNITGLTIRSAHKRKHTAIVGHAYRKTFKKCSFQNFKVATDLSFVFLWLDNVVYHDNEEGLVPHPMISSGGTWYPSTMLLCDKVEFQYNKKGLSLNLRKDTGEGSNSDVIICNLTECGFEHNEEWGIYAPQRIWHLKTEHCWGEANGIGDYYIPNKYSDWTNVNSRFYAKVGSENKSIYAGVVMLDTTNNNRISKGTVIDKVYSKNGGLYYAHPCGMSLRYNTKTNALSVDNVDNQPSIVTVTKIQTGEYSVNLDRAYSYANVFATGISRFAFISTQVRCDYPDDTTTFDDYATMTVVKIRFLDHNQKLIDPEFFKLSISSIHAHRYS